MSGTVVGRVAIQFRSDWNNEEVGKGSAVRGSMTRTSSGEIMIGLAKELPATAVTSEELTGNLFIKVGREAAALVGFATDFLNHVVRLWLLIILLSFSRWARLSR